MFRNILMFIIFISMTSCAQENSGSIDKNKEVNSTQIKNSTMKAYNPLTKEEQKVILQKGTEYPFSGEYTKKKEKGTYLCRQCNAPLYNSTDKFESECGWPSFDDEIKGAVLRKPDADGNRTEILCVNCVAHLGHVFEGEGLTDKNIRHCVNSISLKFIPKEISIIPERAIFAGGCFWGVEYYMNNNPGVLLTTVGYINGKTDNPTYEDVCSHTTGHAEAIEIFFDPNIITFEKLAKLFFEIHDFTQVNRQGPDVGDQYRSAIFYLSDKQKQIADSLVRVLDNKDYKVATEISAAKVFWPAEKYHQDYYEKKGGIPYCHAKKTVF